MKISTSILFTLLILLVAGMLCSNIILKNQYDKVDKSDLYWTYRKVAETPFKHLKITGGNITNIAFEQSNGQPHALSVSQRTKLDSLKSFNKGHFEIQDISSQQTGNFFKPQPNEHWYDCCAASGGKSLLLHSIEPSIHITVSDKRNSILENL